MEKSQIESHYVLARCYMQRHIPRAASLLVQLLLVPAQKNTHYLVVFDSLIIIICLASTVLCARSLILAIKLLQVTCSPLFLYFTFTFFFLCFKSVVRILVSQINSKNVPLRINPLISTESIRSL